jgi:hypothetical protein
MGVTFPVQINGSNFDKTDSSPGELPKKVIVLPQRKS